MVSAYKRRGDSAWYVRYKKLEKWANDRLKDARTKAEAIKEGHRREDAASRTRAAAKVDSNGRPIEGITPTHVISHREARATVPPAPATAPAPASTLDADITTVAELMETWVESFVSRRSYQPERSRTSKWFTGTPFGQTRIADCDRKTVNRWLLGLEHDGVSPQTINRLAVMLSTAWNRAIDHDLIDDLPNPVRAKKRKTKPRRRDALRAEHVKPFLDALPEEWRVICALAIHTGLRKGELLGLRRSSIDREARLITVTHSWNELGTKNGRTDDRIPISDAALPWLDLALEQSDPGSDLLFTTRMRGYCGPRMFRKDTNIAGPIREACAKIGLKGNYDFQSLRVSFVSIALANGVPIHLVQRLARHANIAITNAHYTRVTQADLREAANIATIGRRNVS